MYAVNLGTRGVQEALDVLEYANLRSGTALSDRRVANGAPEPHGIRMWCLGNEMDGPVAARPRDRRRSTAGSPSKTARAMRQIDPDLELVVCGSSSAQMPTFGTWERDRPGGDLRRRRLHLVPRLLRAARAATTPASSPPP